MLCCGEQVLQANGRYRLAGWKVFFNPDTNVFSSNFPPKEKAMTEVELLGVFLVLCPFYPLDLSWQLPLMLMDSVKASLQLGGSSGSSPGTRSQAVPLPLRQFPSFHYLLEDLKCTKKGTTL